MDLKYVDRAGRTHLPRRNSKPGSSDICHHQPLSSVVTMDWPFSDSEPDQPSSPKRVSSHASQQTTPVVDFKSRPLPPVPGTERETSSSRGSSGTDTETRTLLPKSQATESGSIAEQHAETSGARPKSSRATASVADNSPTEDRTVLEASEKDVAVIETSADQDNGNGQWNASNERRLRQNRRAFRRKQSRMESSVTNESDSILPPPPQVDELRSQAGDSDNILDSRDLRQRILEILSSPNEECDRELIKLKKEIEGRKNRIEDDDGKPNNEEFGNASSNISSNNRARAWPEPLILDGKKITKHS